MVPTILIGLGGVGSRVVDTLYARLSDKDRKRVVIHAVDTDINDIQRLPHIGQERASQIGTHGTVGDYRRELKRSGAATSVERWFPPAVPDHQTITNGAGQTRAVARLALHASLRRDGLPKLRNQLIALFKVKGKEALTTARVIIVCTMAGGTGSGTFLQIARYTRELITEINPQIKALVRLMSVMPSVAVNFNHKEFEHPRMMANGYACLKELNAMLLPPGEERPDIQLEYRPNQLQDAHGNVDLSVPVSPPIYDFCFLTERVNQKGEGLQTWDHFEAQALDALYLQLFSPVANNNFSQEDNVLTQLIGDDTNARFCGAGVARLEYPYAELRDYLVEQNLVTMVSEDWLELDRRYDDARQRWKEEGERGAAPRRSEVYQRNLQAEATRENVRPFWRDIWNSLHILDDRGTPSRPKTSVFIDTVDAHLEKLIEDWEPVKKSRAAVPENVDTGMMTIDQIGEYVAGTEHALQRFEDEIRIAVPDIVATAVNDILYRARREKDGFLPETLWTWLGGAQVGETLHPVATRAFLYRLIDTLDEKVLALESEHEVLDKGVRGYLAQFDDPETDEIETPHLLYMRIRDRGIYERIRRLNDTPKRFAADYDNRARMQFQRLDRCIKVAVKLGTYKKIRSFSAELLRAWHEAFQDLSGRLADMERGTSQLARRHDEQTDPTHVYVLASKDNKKAIWREVENQVENQQGGEFRDAAYAYFLQVAERSLGPRSRQQVETTDARALVDGIRSWTHERIGGLSFLKMNVVEALRKEARLEALDEADHVESRLKALPQLATPLINAVRKSGDYAIWGLHPDSANTLGSDLEKLSDHRNVNAEFSPHVIWRYQAVYQYKAQDLLDFTDGNAQGADRAGRSYNEYHRYLKGIDAPGCPRVTPHLDRNWHLAAYLPDLNPNKAQLVIAGIERAFLYGLLLDIFKAVKDKGSDVWQVVLGSRTELLKVAGNAVPAELYRLFDALKLNPGIVDEVLEIADMTKALQSQSYQRISDSPLYKNLTAKNVWNGFALLDTVLQLPRVAGAKAHIDRTDVALATRLLEIAIDIYLSFNGCSDAKGLSKQACTSYRNLVNKMYADAKKMPKKGSSAQNTLDGIKNEMFGKLPH